MSANVVALAIDPQSLSTLYAGTGTAVVAFLKVANGGDEWIAMNNGLDATYIYSLAVDPKTQNILYAGTDFGLPL